MKLKNFKEFVNESRDTGLNVVFNKYIDYDKAINIFNNSNFYFEEFADKYLFFPEDKQNYDSLEIELQKILDKNNLNAYIEAIW